MTFRLIAFILFALASAPSSAQEAFPFFNKPGSFAVGFRVVEQVDPSRSYPATAPQDVRKPRPIQTAIWYPAVKGGKPMRYCLDGTVRYRHAMLEKVPYLKPEQLRTSLLYLARRPPPFERGLKFKPDHSGSILQKMTGADVYLVTMYAMEHVYFGTSYLRLDPLDFGDYTRDEIAQSYALASRYVLNFLNGALKGASVSAIRIATAYI